MNSAKDQPGHLPHGDEVALEVFRSPVIERMRSGDKPDVWSLPGGELVLPRVFGFCRGVKRALMMAAQATSRHAAQPHHGKLILLGEIIHNPWVNDYVCRQGVQILTAEQCSSDRLDRYVRPDDCAIIPAFGVPLPIEQKLRQIGCEIIDCSCGDVIRLWRWGCQAIAEGFGVLIFGRPRHDETVVTKSRLAEAGGAYLVVENISRVRQFAKMVTGESDDAFREVFDDDATNADSISPLMRLAQVSQTTMLYSHTMEVREILRAAFIRRFGRVDEDRLRFQPTVCRATQDRQNAAVELCQTGCDVMIVVGGFGSSNTRHLYELAGQYAPAYLIEDAEAIISAGQLLAWDSAAGDAAVTRDWLPKNRPLRIGILAGASSPEIVIGQVLQHLAAFLQKKP
jgi:4-hydroxy-3-methylbut-2-enyl diphosphate reductase